MELICSQPSSLYSEWQLLVLIQNLRKFNGELILNIILIGEPLSSIDKLALYFKWVKVFYYQDLDERRKEYVPNNKIYGYMQHWNKYPELEHVHYLFVDADCLILNKPILKQSDIHYGPVIGKIMRSNPTIEKQIGISCNNNIIGLFYYGKGYTSEFWKSVYNDAYFIYDLKIPNETWICEMRAWYYNLIKFNFKTEYTNELDYGDGVKFGKNVYHHIQHLFFNKKDYKNTYPWEVEPTSEVKNFSSIIYYEAIKDCKDNLLKLI